MSKAWLWYPGSRTFGTAGSVADRTELLVGWCLWGALPRNAHIPVRAHSYVMSNMTLSIPDELREEMRKHPEINWSEIARQALRREIERLHVYDRLLSGSSLSEEDAVEMGREIRRAAARDRR